MEVIVGVGTELKRLLKKCCIKSGMGCHCDAHANLMDQEGSDWCEENISTIVRWMNEEVNKRKLLGHLPFRERFAYKLVRRAIRNTRRKLKALEQ